MDIGEQLELLLAQSKETDGANKIGEINGFDILLEHKKGFGEQSTLFADKLEVIIKGALEYKTELAQNNVIGNVMRIENLFDNIKDRAEMIENSLNYLISDKATADSEVKKNIPEWQNTTRKPHVLYSLPLNLQAMKKL